MLIVDTYNFQKKLNLAFCRQYNVEALLVIKSFVKFLILYF